MKAASFYELNSGGLMTIKNESKLATIEVLLVEDNFGDAELVIEMASNYDVRRVQLTHVTTLSEALQAFSAKTFDVVLFDLSLPDSFGIEAIAELKEVSAQTPIVVLTGNIASDLAFQALNNGAQDYLNKNDLTSRELFRALNFAIERGVYHDKLAQLDIEKRMAETQTLLAQNARLVAESANSAKSSFLTNMSHEIRTPLGVIIGYADLALAKEAKPREQRTYLEGIQRNSKHLAQLVNDILDLAKVESEIFELDISEFGLQDFLSDLAKGYVMKSGLKGLKLETVFSTEIPASISTDRMRLTQILSNLLGNAIKFTEQGTIQLRVFLERDELQKNRLVFAVTDSGIGLSQDQQQRLFKPFVQADDSVTRKFGGTGLGLVLAKKLATLLGGDLILLSSQLNDGSCFQISIPLEEVESCQEKLLGASGAESDPCNTLEGCKILLVEDSVDNQIIISRYLKKVGASVTCRENGETGAAAALSGSFDVVLMDVQMPVMEGNVATVRLRSAGYQRPIIALTAHAMKEERDRALRSGFSDYLTKPIDFTLLIETLKKHVGVMSA